MARKVYKWVKATKSFVELGAPELVISPTVIQDTIEDTKHPIDRKIYNSKSAYEAVTRRHGCVEIGPDGCKAMVENWKGPGDVNVKGAIEKAFYKLSQGYQPAPLERDESITRVLNDRGRN